MSTAFFCTIRPKVGFINEASMDFLNKYLEKQVAYVISVEDKPNVGTNARHVHFSFITNKPMRTDSIKRSLKVAMQKFYSTFQLNVKVAISQGVVDYILKDDFIVFQHNIGLLRDYITKDSARNEQEIKINSYYKNEKLRFAYDNKSTWQPYFDKHTITVEQWSHLIIHLNGNISPNFYKLKSFYNYYTIKQDETQSDIVQQICKESETFFQNIPSSSPLS